MTDTFFLDGVSFTLGGESVPARDLAWAMVAPCGCISGLHLMTEDTINESMAWQQMSGNAAMLKRDKGRGFQIRMVKHREVPWGDCPHSPKWGYVPPPTPVDHSWASTSTARTLHLVPLTAADKESAEESGNEWVVEEIDRWRREVASVCGKSTNVVGVWSKKWHRTNGKVECSGCLKIVEAQVLPLPIGPSCEASS